MNLRCWPAPRAFDIALSSVRDPLYFRRRKPADRQWGSSKLGAAECAASHTFVQSICHAVNYGHSRESVSPSEQYMLSNGDECMRNELDLFAQGRVNTFEWALEAEAVGTIEPRTFLRKLACPRLYAAPSDTWQQVWRRAGEWVGKRGEYDLSASPLDVWAQCGGDHSIESTSPLERWPELARSLRRGPRIRTGLVAVQTTGTGPQAYPGVSVVVETPSGGSAGALMLVQLFARQGIGGCLATQADNDRWGIVKLIYSPCWYAADEERVFGVDWARWTGAPGDQNESKRLWCEHATLAIAQVVREFPPLCIDSVFFEEYAATDRLWLLSKRQLRHLCDVSQGQLGAELTRLTAEPLPIAAFQQHWSAMAGRKHVVEVLEGLFRRREVCSD